MYKIGMIGDRDSVLGFSALGLKIHEANTREQAATLLQELVKSGEYAVLFLTDTLAAVLEDELAAYKDLPLPAITVIPGKDGASGYGTAMLRRAATRAIGADILFKD